MIANARSAGVGLQLAALLFGLAAGLVLFYVVGTLLLVYLPDWTEGPLRGCAVIFATYYLVAPADWRGLVRRCCLVLSASILVYAALGYGVRSLGADFGGMPDLPGLVQVVLILVLLCLLLGALLLRSRPRPL